MHNMGWEEGATEARKRKRKKGWGKKDVEREDVELKGRINYSYNPIIKGERHV